MRQTYWLIRMVFLSVAYPWLFISVIAAEWQPFQWHWALRLLWVIQFLVAVHYWPEDPKAK